MFFCIGLLLLNITLVRVMQAVTRSCRSCSLKVGHCSVMDKLSLLCSRICAVCCWAPPQMNTS